MGCISLPALAAIGSVAGAAGTVMGGMAQSQAASYQAAIAQNNATTAQQNATYATEAGAAKTQQAGLQGAESVGAVKTALAANNVDVNTGSALDVETGTREKSALSEETIANNAELQAYGYSTQATGYELTSQLDQNTATDAPIGAALSAGGSLLGNANAMAGFSKWVGGLGAGSSAASYGPVQAAGG